MKINVLVKTLTKDYLSATYNSSTECFISKHNSDIINDVNKVYVPVLNKGLCPVSLDTFKTVLSNFNIK